MAKLANKVTMGFQNYPNLRKEELYLISRAEFEKRKLITSDFARKLFPQPQVSAAVLNSLREKGRLIRLQRGKYLLVPIKAPNQQWMPNEFIVAGLWMDTTPYYIGYFTMFHYWGLTDQIPQTVFIINSRRNAEVRIGYSRYRALKVGLTRLYGIQRLDLEGESVCISDLERTLVDFMHKPIGTLNETLSTLRNVRAKIDFSRLIEYIGEFPILSLRRRAGYLLERAGFASSILDLLKEKLGHPQTYVVLDPRIKSRRGKVDKKWGVIVNR